MRSSMDTSGRGRGKGKGRPTADVWTLFTDSEHPQRLQSCACRHCGALITHYKKSERVKSHLARKCAPFRALMLGLVDNLERPDWFTDMHVRAKRARKAAKAVVVAPASDSETESESESDPESAPPPAVKKAKTTAAAAGRAGSLPLTSKKQQDVTDNKQQDALHELLAMHFYVTDTPLPSVEDSFLLRAFRLGHPDVELPNSRLLKGKLLDKCYKKIKALVEKMDKTKNQAKEAEALDESVSTDGNAVVRVCAQLIHDIFAPDNHDETSRAADLSPFKHVVDFVEECGAVVSFFTDSDSDSQMKSTLEKEQQAQGLEPLVAFSPQSRHSPWHWRNLKPYLDRIKLSEDLIYELVTANKFLGDDPSGRKLKQKTVEQRERMVEVLLGGSFFEQLSKCIQILTPIHAAMLSTTLVVAEDEQATGPASKAQVPISTGYHSLCRTLKKEFAKLSCLNSGERAHLSALIREKLVELSRSKFGMAYLLDPRFLGMGMTDDERDHAEDQLFDFFQRTGRDGDDDDSSASLGEHNHKKEQLFQEYTDFVVKGNSAKQRGGPQYQMLEKGTKSIQQYWLTDAKQFPLLQQVALAVFKPDNDTSDSSTSSPATAPAAASTPQPSSSSLPSARQGQGLNKVQLRKIAFIKTHAVLLHESDADRAWASGATKSNVGEAATAASYCVKEIII